jgi:hypothetical protein
MKSISIIFFTCVAVNLFNIGFMAPTLPDIYRFPLMLGGLILLKVSVDIAFEIGV